MKIRKADLKDLAAILDVFEMSIRVLCEEDYTKEQIEVWAMAGEKTEKWRTRIELQYFLVATIDEKIVGFAALEGWNYVDLMYIHPDFTGQGIASQLYEQLEQAAKANGSGYLLSDVSITARPFVEQRGFRLLHPNQNLIGGVEIINFRMRKDF